MNKTFFTSDTHFGHKNICGENGFEKGRKHFANTDEMDAAIIQAWNEVVGLKDTVYHLGDMFLNGGTGYMKKIIGQLNGKIIWIAGNHDSFKTGRRLERYFNDIQIDGEPKLRFNTGLERLIVDGNTLYLSHFPMVIGVRPNIFSIHGHIHSHPSLHTNHINVGIDNVEKEFIDLAFGTPISLEQLMVCVHKCNYLTVRITSLDSLYKNKRGSEDIETESIF